MRVFIASTPEELEPHQAAASDVAHGLGLEPVLRDPTTGRGLDPVRACARQVATADLVLAIVGWRRGRVPPPELGGDGFHPWTWWEAKSAFDHGKPVVVLMAGESWPPELREEDPGARAVMQDFRGELGRLASFFDDEPTGGSPPLPGFRELVRRRLLDAQHDLGEKPAADDGVRLRRSPPPELPERPYPVLLPYTHPDLMAGRDRELDELCRTLTLPVPIVGFYALAGTGKSSLLAAGLLPRLRAERRPVASVRHPAEPGLAGRLIGDLLEADDESVLEVDDEDHGRFVELLLAARTLAGRPPVLVLDQFEDLFHRPEGSRARAVAGVLLAASVQRQPGLEGPLCQWLLAYRQEVHGEIFEWLGDALREARGLGLAGAEALPHELSGAERFHARVLAPLGTPPVGCADTRWAKRRGSSRRPSRRRSGCARPVAQRGIRGASPATTWRASPGPPARPGWRSHGRRWCPSCKSCWRTFWPRSRRRPRLGWVGASPLVPRGDRGGIKPRGERPSSGCLTSRAR